MDFIKLNFPNNKILLFYRCGSYAFNTSTSSSDEDFVVVLDNYEGMSHIGSDKKEYFIFGKNDWIKKMEFSDDIDEYYEIYNDEILSLPSGALFIDESMTNLVNKYKEEFTSRIFKWLQKNYFHYKLYLETNRVNKSFYHLFRIRQIVDNYIKSGFFSLELSNDVLRKIKNFKNSSNKYEYLKEIKEIIYYIGRLKEDDL